MEAAVHPGIAFFDQVHMNGQPRALPGAKSLHRELEATTPKAVALFVCCSHCLAVCLFVMSGAIAAQDPQKDVGDSRIPAKNYAQAYFQSFKGSEARPEGWNFASRLSEECVQFEPSGLRVTLLPGGPEKGQTAGIVSGFTVKGDFEITLTFEALKDPDPADVGKSGTRLTLAVALNTPLLGTPKQEVATLSRGMASKGFVTWVRNRHDPSPLTDTFPTPATTGRLRLVRIGEELFYLASIGADQPFTLLTRYRFGAEDVKRIAISGQTGGEKAMVDMRVTDFSIRADAIPDAPASGVATQPAPVPPPQRGRGGLLLTMLLSLTIVGLLMLAFFLRKRGNPSGSN